MRQIVYEYQLRSLISCIFPRETTNINNQTGLFPLKGLSLDILPLFILACMDASRPEYEPLLFLAFLLCSFVFLDNYFKFLCISWQTFLEILKISKEVQQLSLLSNFRLFPYWQFSENVDFVNTSLRSIYTLSSVSQSNANRGKITLENRGHFVKPFFYGFSESPRRFGMIRIRT